MRAQPDIAEGAIVQHHVDDRQAITGGRLHVHAVHLHAAVAGDDRNPTPRLRALHPDRRGNGPAHRSEIGGGDISPRLIGAPIMPCEGAVRAGIHQQNAVARKDCAQRRHRGGGMDRLGGAMTILGVVEPWSCLDLGNPGLPRRLAFRECVRRRAFVAIEQIKESVAAARHDMAGFAARGDFVHVGIDVDHLRRGFSAQRPVHGVALVEARAKDQQDFEIGGEKSCGRVPRPGIAEHAEGQSHGLREKRLWPAASSRPESTSVQQASSTQPRRSRARCRRRRGSQCACFGREGNRSLGRRQAERHHVVEEIGNRDILRIAIRDQDIVSK